MIVDGITTTTSRDQLDLEKKVLQHFRDYLEDGLLDEDPELVLTRKQHATYLQGGLGELPSGFIALDASRTWICYWITHALALLGAPLPKTLPKSSIVGFLVTCQHPDGGFGGGPYQLAHLAPTYAAVAALVSLGGEEAYRVIDREKLWRYLLRMCVPPGRGGGMTMHEGGEVDVRGCYCALAVCHMLNLDQQTLAEACGMVQYIRSCQSYEGGVGGEPWNEAHGGYTFCGVAALMLLGRTDALHIPKLLQWAANRQGSMEGGFMGRTNKLVDGCYSYWQGAAFPLLEQLLTTQQAQHGGPPTGAQQAQRVEGSCDGEMLAASAKRVAGQLLSGEEEAFVGALRPLSPVAAAEAQLARWQRELDELVDQSLQADERYKAAVEAQEERSQDLKQEAAALLEQAAAAQQAVDRTTSQLEATQCSAATLVQAATGSQQEASSKDWGNKESLTERLQLYNAAALQLWLLKCCQAPRGGLRDKPGKPPDYYHTCYCLSGLASSQHHSQVMLGGADNLLTKADPVCNVVEEKLHQALAYFGKLPQPH